MLNHLIDPDIPTKRQELEHDIAEKQDEIDAIENQLQVLKDKLDCAKLERRELIDNLCVLEPDPDRDR